MREIVIREKDWWRFDSTIFAAAAIILFGMGTFTSFVCGIISVIAAYQCWRNYKKKDKEDY